MRKFLVTIDGKQYDVAVEEVANDGSVVTPAVTAVKPAAPVAAPKVAAPANGTKILAPMPGMIKSLCVADGTKVEKGQVIYILEAMKMDNDMTADCAGVITFKVAKGTNVETGAVVAVIA